MKIIQLLKADLTKIPTKDLLFKHAIVVALIKKARKTRKNQGGLSLTQLILLDKKITKELTKRGIKTHKFWRSVERFLPFQIKNPYIVITGSVFYDTPHDLDIMIFTPYILEDDVIASKARKALDPYLPPSTHWLNSYYTTPFSKYAPVYHLEVTPKLISRSFAPMFPKTNEGEPLSINLDRIVSRLPQKVTLWKNFVYYHPAKHTLIIPQLLAQYYVPLYVRLTRMFPVEERPTIKTTKIGGSLEGVIPVYDLTLKKALFKVVEM